MKTKLLLLLVSIIAVGSLSSCDVYASPYGYGYGGYGYGYGRSYRPSYYSGGYRGYSHPSHHGHPHSYGGSHGYGGSYGGGHSSHHGGHHH